MTSAVLELLRHELSHHKEAQSYLSGRGLRSEILEKASVGFIPELPPTGLISAISRLGWDSYAANNRIVFPSVHDKQLVMVATRSIDNAEPKHKILYAKDLRYPYGLQSSPDPKNDPLILVESPICALTLHQAGLPALALYGIGMASKKIPFLGSKWNKFVLIADNDSAGQGVAGFTKFGIDLKTQFPKATVCVAVPKKLPGHSKTDVNDLYNNLGSGFRDEIIRLIKQSWGKPLVAESKKAAPKSKKTNNLDDLKSISIHSICGALGYQVHQKSSDRSYIKCPQHNDSDPSLVIYNRTNTFCCFSCKSQRSDAGGDAIKFVEFTQGKSFVDSINWLKETFGVK